MYIATRVGMLFSEGEKEIAILSKDKDFQAIIEYLSFISKGKVRIVKASDIAHCLISFNSKPDKDRRRQINDLIKSINLDQLS